MDGQGRLKDGEAGGVPRGLPCLLSLPRSWAAAIREDPGAGHNVPGLELRWQLSWRVRLLNISSEPSLSQPPPQS